MPDPRCAVCGGPFPDGSGCEFCPDLTPEKRKPTVIYDERYKDILADRIVTDGRGMEIYGKDLDGRNVWIWIHTNAATELINVEGASTNGNGE